MLVVMWNFISRNMTGGNLFTNILLLVLAIIFSIISQCSSILSDERLCYNSDCSEPVSQAKTVMQYHSRDPDVLSFGVNTEVKVYSKEAGSRTDLWGVEINGKHGYVPKKFLREYKILHKELTYKVPTNPSGTNNATFKKSKGYTKESKFDEKNVMGTSPPADNANAKSDKELPDKKIIATPTFEVIDGTTIPLTQSVPSVQSPSASEVIVPVVVPNGHNLGDETNINSLNGRTKQNIFTEQDKVSENALKNEIKDEKDGGINKIDINDFITNSEVTLDLPKVTGVEVAPSNENKISNKIEDRILDKKGDSASDSESGQLLETASASNASKAVTSNDSKDKLNTDSADVENLHSSKTETEKAKGTIKPDVQVTKSLDEIETNEIQSSKSEAAVITNDTKTDEQNAESTEQIEPKDTEPSESISAGATNDTKLDVQVTESSNKLESNDTQPLKTETIITSTDPQTDKQNAENTEQIKPKDTEPSKSISAGATNDTKLDVQVTESSNKLESNDTQPLKTETIITSTDPQTDKQNAENTEKIEPKDTEPSKSISAGATNDTKLDVQVTESSNKLESNDIRHLKTETIITSTDPQTDKQNAENTEKIEPKDAEPSKSTSASATNDIKADVQIIEDSSKLESNDIPSSKNETMLISSHTKTDEQKIEEKYTEAPESIIPALTGDTKPVTEDSSKIEMKESQTLRNETVMADIDTKVDLPSTQISDTPQVKGTEFPESIGALTDDAKSDVQNTESSPQTEQKLEGSKTDSGSNTKSETGDADKVIEQSFQSMKNFLNEKKEFLPNEGVALLETKQTESERGNEHESAEDFNAYNSNEYTSPLFLQLHAKNRLSLAVAPNDVEAPAQYTTASAEETASKPKSDVDVDEAILAAEVDENVEIEDSTSAKDASLQSMIHEVQVSASGVCTADIDCSPGDNTQNEFPHHEQFSQANVGAVMDELHLDTNYWMTLMYLSITAISTLLFSLGYYWIENMRRDRQLIAKINKLEKDLLISEAECTTLNENLKSTTEKLKRMEDESFGSDEMVLSLKADLEASQNAKAELEDQVALLEKDLDSATEAGLELEKMLREVLSSNNEMNPLAQSVEDLQTRLNAQKVANESLTKALAVKKEENESLLSGLASIKKKSGELEVELARVTEKLRLEINNNQALNDKVQKLEMQIKEISTQKASLQKELKGKEVEVNQLVEVISKLKSNNLDLDKLYDVSRIKAEATALLEERNELKVRLADVEGAHNLLQEHMTVIQEEIATLREQYKAAEKGKKDAEAGLEMLTTFFGEKEAQREKEEAIWLQQQDEVSSIVEGIQTMQDEIQNYKQQIEMLKREILDQEREYKGQISLLETKAHEQWVIARQVERRLEESKLEASQLRNRLTLIEKNINDGDPEAKLHRLDANGETTSSSLYIGAESSSSPIMFSGSSNVPPPPPPSYLHALFPPYLPPPLPNASAVPPYEVSQRPPPLGGRLSSPPPMPPLHPSASNRYENAGSPPPMSPHIHPPFDHRSPPPPFGSDMHPPLPPPPGSILPPSLGAPHSWGEESLPPLRNTGFHPPQRERVRNHKGSLHSSGDSLDKTHHSKV